MLPAYLFRITFSLENPLYWNFTEGTSKLFNDYCRTNKAALMVNFYWTKGEVVWLVNFVPNSTSLYLVDPSNTNRLSTRNDQYSTNAFSSFSVKKRPVPTKSQLRAFLFLAFGTYTNHSNLLNLFPLVKLSWTERVKKLWRCGKDFAKLQSIECKYFQCLQVFCMCKQMFCKLVST